MYIKTELLDYFSKDVIISRYEHVLNLLSTFCLQFNTDKLTINELILGDVIIDYFSSIKETKSYHIVKQISEAKEHAYMSYWFLRRKPIQVCLSREDSKFNFINEKFVVTYIMSYLVNVNEPYNSNTTLYNFVDQLLYFIKYKDITIDTLELMIVAFQAGLAAKSI